MQYRCVTSHVPKMLCQNHDKNCDRNAHFLHTCTCIWKRRVRYNMHNGLNHTNTSIVPKQIHGHTNKWTWMHKSVKTMTSHERRVCATHQGQGISYFNTPFVLYTHYRYILVHRYILVSASPSKNIDVKHFYVYSSFSKG